MTLRKIVQLIFIKESLILLFAIIWLWFSVALYSDARYTVKDLIPHTGKIVLLDSVIIRVKDKPLYKEVKKELRLHLDSESYIFTLETTSSFEYVTSKVSIGDTVTLFIKPKLWGIFGMKKAFVISHLTKHNEIIIDYSKYRQSISGLTYLIIAFSAIMFIIYIVNFKKRLWWDFGGYEKASAS